MPPDAGCAASCSPIRQEHGADPFEYTCESSALAHQNLDERIRNVDTGTGIEQDAMRQTQFR